MHPHVQSAAERYVELLERLTCASALDYDAVRVTGGGEYYCEPEGLDELMMLERCIGETIHGRFVKALVWKDMLFCQMSAQQAARAYGERAELGHVHRSLRTISDTTATNWTGELNARFEAALRRYGLLLISNGVKP